MIDEAEEIPLSTKQLAAIGRVAVLASILENEMQLLIFRLLDVAGLVGFAVTAGQGFNARREMMDLLGDALISTWSDLEWLQRVSSKAQKAYERRNDIVHAQWMPGFDTRPLQHQIKRRIVVKLRHVSDADFAEAQRLLEDAVVELREFTFRREIAGREILIPNGKAQREMTKRSEAIGS